MLVDFVAERGWADENFNPSSANKAQIATTLAVIHQQTPSYLKY